MHVIGANELLEKISRPTHIVVIERQPTTWMSTPYVIQDLLTSRSLQEEVNIHLRMKSCTDDAFPKCG
jgi:hypothetical protein